MTDTVYSESVLNETATAAVTFTTNNTSAALSSSDDYSSALGASGLKSHANDDSIVSENGMHNNNNNNVQPYNSVPLVSSTNGNVFQSPLEGEIEVYYTEETSWRLHGGRYDATASQNLKPLPEAPPICPSQFPPRWTFNEVSRVLYGDFTDHPKGPLEPEDLVFLLQMMERDDITVVTEGFSCVDPDLWTLSMLESLVGDDVCHQFRVFERRLVLQNGNYFESFEEQGQCCNMTMKDYIRYIQQRNDQLKCIEQRRQSTLTNTFKSTLSPAEDALHRNELEETFTYTTFKDSQTHTINCINTILYLIDYDFGKLLPAQYDDFIRNYIAPQLLPGSQFCLMHAVNAAGRPFMGPNLYITPPGSFTNFHQDGHGTVDSGHQCLSGYNEVVMLRRLTETHKRNAIKLLNGEDYFYHDALYGLPHAEGAAVKAPRWPHVEDIDQCKEMNYYPSVFILKPGQFVHINKGRLHAFRKLSFSLLPDRDCHSNLRNEIIHESNRKNLPLNDSLCVSVAWDWTYRGFSSEGINREVSSMMECAALNRERGSQSLAIPETSLLFTAKFFVARANKALKLTNYDCMLSWNGYKNASSLRCSPPLSPEPVSVLRGILPSLAHLVARHKAAVENAKRSAAGEENHRQLSPSLFPDCWENPRQFSIDPYGNDFFCRLCQEELANVYMHCYGCEEILNKDFNICIGCHAESRFKKKILMHPLNNKNHSTINHTGHYTLNRQSRCPCKNGPVCKGCGFCAGCSCKCHQSFILRFRFMHLASEETLLHSVKKVVGSNEIKFAQETSKKLGFFRPIVSFNDNLQIENTRSGMDIVVDQSTLNSTSFQITRRVDNRYSIEELVELDCLQNKEKVPVIVDASTGIGDVNEMSYEENSKQCGEFTDSEAQAQVEVANPFGAASEGNNENIEPAIKNGMDSVVDQSSLNSTSSQIIRRANNIYSIEKLIELDCLQNKEKIPVMIEASTRIGDVNEMSYEGNTKIKDFGELTDSDAQAQVEVANASGAASKGDDESIIERRATRLPTIFSSTIKRFSSYISPPPWFKVKDLLTRKKPQTVTASSNMANATSEISFAVNSKGELGAADSQAFLEEENLHQKKKDEQPVLHNRRDAERQAPPNSPYSTITERQCKSVDDTMPKVTTSSNMTNATSEFSVNLRGELGATDAQAFLEDKNLHKNNDDERKVMHNRHDAERQTPSNASYTTIVKKPRKYVDDPITEQETMSPTNNSTTCEASPRRFGRWDVSEVQALLKGHSIYGNDWRAVCEYVPGRDNIQCKNKYKNLNISCNDEMKVSAREATSSSLSADVGMQESAVKKRTTATSECSTMSKRPRRPTNYNEDEPFGVFFGDEAKVLASDGTSTTLSTDAVAENLVVPEHPTATGADCLASPNISEGAITATFADL